MSSGNRFLPRKKTRTIEFDFSDKAFKDHIIAFLYASSYLKDNEDILSLEINLPKTVPIKYTFK